MFAILSACLSCQPCQLGRRARELENRAGAQFIFEELQIAWLVVDAVLARHAVVVGGVEILAVPPYGGVQHGTVGQVREHIADPRCLVAAVVGAGELRDEHGTVTALFGVSKDGIVDLRERAPDLAFIVGAVVIARDAVEIAALVGIVHGHTVPLKIGE